MDVESLATINAGIDRLQAVGMTLIDRLNTGMAQTGTALITTAQATGSVLIDRSMTQASNILNVNLIPALQEIAALRVELAAWRGLLGRFNLSEPNA